jgi:hypothetical protein
VVLFKVCIGLDWMCFFDHVNHFIQLNQNYCVFGYLPYAFIALHFQMAAVLSQKIQYPTAQTEVLALNFFNDYYFTFLVL